jgi:hypothetical protein
MFFPLGSILLLTLIVAVIVIGSKVRANSQKLDQLDEMIRKK